MPEDNVDLTPPVFLRFRDTVVRVDRGFADSWYLIEERGFMHRPSHKRFLLLGGPGDYLTCLPAGDPRLHDRYRQWVVLMKINRPLSPQLVHEAEMWAVRTFEC